MSNPIVRFFKALGHGLKKLKLGQISRFVLNRFTEEQLDLAISKVQEAAEKFASNPNRRTWVLHELGLVTHLPEHLNNLLLEYAVTYLKNKETELFKKLDDALTPEEHEAAMEAGAIEGVKSTTPPAPPSSGTAHS